MWLILAQEHDISAALRHAKAVLTAPGNASEASAAAAAAPAAVGGSRVVLLARKRQLQEDAARDNENWQQYGRQEEVSAPARSSRRCV